MQDQEGSSQSFCFGRRHANGFNMAFCDGSVQTVSYTINPAIHRCLGNRADGEAIDAKKAAF